MTENKSYIEGNEIQESKEEQLQEPTTSIKAFSRSKKAPPLAKKMCNISHQMYEPPKTNIWPKIHFWEDTWLSKHPLKFQFPNLFQIIRSRNMLISSTIHQSATSPSWNFNFHGNLLDPKIEELTSLLSSLHHVYIPPSFTDGRVSLTPSSIFIVSSSYKALSVAPPSPVWSLDLFCSC